MKYFLIGSLIISLAALIRYLVSARGKIASLAFWIEFISLVSGVLIAFAVIRVVLC